jgi:predicted dehydrogenase
MTDPVRFGYIGCGYIAQHVHLPNFAALAAAGQCDFLALAEARPDLGARVARRYGIPTVYRDHRQMADDSRIEAVGLSAPFALQGRIAEDLLRAGKHVFMEKPMAVSVARAEAIIEAQHAGGGRLMVGYMKRYDAGNILIKRHLDAWRRSGEAGRLLYARAHGFCGNWIYALDQNVVFESSTEVPPPSPEREETPAWLPEPWRRPYIDYLQQWTHNINLLRWFLGGEPTVRAVDLDADGMTGLVVLDIGGVRAVVESAQTRFHGWEEQTQFYFEGGWLRTEAPPLLQKETPATVEIYRAAEGGQPPRLTREFAPANWAFREEARHFLQSVRNGTPFASSAEDTLADVRLFEDVYRRVIAAK